MKQILWLNHGYLAGDDTDSHVDTLVRLCNKHTMAYVKCDDENDEHYSELKKIIHSNSTVLLVNKSKIG